MSSWHAVGLFCDDIREDNRTLLGIYPDNLAFPELPSGLPKMGVYVRVNVPSDVPAQNISVRIRSVDGDNEIGKFDAEYVRKAQQSNLSNQLPLTGFVVIAIAAPMVFKQPGQIYLVARFGDEEAICGNLRIVPPEAQTVSTSISSTEPEPHA